MEQQAFAQLLGNYGEFIGAIAVVITLIYLTTQVRQNTSQIRNEGHTRIADSYNEIVKELITDDRLFKLVVIGCQDWDKLSTFEKSRFHLFFHQHLNHYRLAHQLYEKGAIDDDVFRSIEDLHLNVLGNPGARVWWAMVGTGLVEGRLRERIEAELDARLNTRQATTEAWDFYDPKYWDDEDR